MAEQAARPWNQKARRLRTEQQRFSKRTAHRHAIQIVVTYQAFARTHAACKISSRTANFFQHPRKTALANSLHPSAFSAASALNIQRTPQSGDSMSYPDGHPFLLFVCIGRMLNRINPPDDRRLPVNASPANVTISKKGDASGRKHPLSCV